VIEAEKKTGVLIRTFFFSCRPVTASSALPTDAMRVGLCRQGRRFRKRDNPLCGGLSRENWFQAGRFRGAGSQPVSASSRSARAASSDFFILAHAGAVAPFIS